MPDYPNREQAEKVTVHHLLTHTSGLGERKEPAEKSTSRRKLLAMKEYLPAFAQVPQKFEPGARLDYNNDGYLLLGAVVERASGQSYFDFVRENVYKRAGMADTDCYDLETDPPNLATGYMDAQDGPRRSNTFMLPVRRDALRPGVLDGERPGPLRPGSPHGKLLDAKSLEAVWTGGRTARSRAASTATGSTSSGTTGRA